MGALFTKRNITIALIIAVFGIGVLAFINLNKKAPAPPPVVPVETTSKPQLTTIGKSVEGRNIEAYTYGEGENYLLFVGGIHGGYEWNSVLLAYKFMDYLEANPDVIPKNLKITIIPSANPDGIYRVTGKDGRFAMSNVSTSQPVLEAGRFNKNKVDLNRNFACKWQPKSTWRNEIVSAGTKAFSEPEAAAIRDLVLKQKPVGAVFWHSQANAVYTSECETGVLPTTLKMVNIYAGASGYQEVKSFNAYEITGDAEGWLASINVPTITVELKTHETIEWEKNLAGTKALLSYFGQEIKK